MAYSNEYLTEEEIELIKKTEHWSIVRKSGDEVCCLRHRGTVDREKRIWVIEYREGYSYDPKTYEHTFVVYWGKISKESMIELCLKYMGAEKDDEIKKNYNVELINYWAFKAVKIPQSLDIKEEAVLSELEGIMTAYAISGNPEENKYKGRIKAIMREDNEVA